MAPHLCGAFLCLQVQLCDAKMKKSCYKLILGEGKNSLSQMLEILQDEDFKLNCIEK